MTAMPWDKFYWSDYESDTALKLCSLAAQGLWMRMLCICAHAEPKGFLMVAGKPLSIDDMASLFGKPVSEIEPLLNELESREIFSRNKAGNIYNRRMIRTEKKARTARENGKNGGNPTLSKQTEIHASDNQIQTDDEKNPPADEATNLPSNNQKLEARSQKPDKIHPPSEDSPSLPLGAPLPAVVPVEQDAVAAYNALAERCKLPLVQRLNPQRRTKLRRRLAECGGIEGWKLALAKLEANPWMHGDNDRGWRADFDFLLQEKSFTKLMEGSYDRRPNRSGGASAEEAWNNVFGDGGGSDAVARIGSGA
jgi:hypothetical protein